jgi:hypothetical protein
MLAGHTPGIAPRRKGRPPGGSETRHSFNLRTGPSVKESPGRMQTKLRAASTPGVMPLPAAAFTANRASFAAESLLEPHL